MSVSMASANCVSVRWILEIMQKLHICTTIRIEMALSGAVDGGDAMLRQLKCCDRKREK